ncbi:hypothetical protein VIA_002803 [Vibrio orientalis CIP 102891 = ATCC 33934]|uniref:Uncharacterized protein n=1 Tax=Vibrio orientalis CIP 102891 = ATCC 33934 TaxID=675816 RepID=A0ABP2GZ61_VIBOR|nr:hypothetical protein VIA_002803 [Vibrio orientalis CIP 102891 = ATCC 33934]
MDTSHQTLDLSLGTYVQELENRNATEKMSLRLSIDLVTP